MEGLSLLSNRWRLRWDHELPWYAEEKARRGAFAAFVGVKIEALSWKAVAVGDCCLFVWDSQKNACRSFPLAQPEEFGVSPFLIGSTSQADVADKLRHAEGHLNPGDRLLLMSDAISHWYMENLSTNPSANAKFEDLMARKGRAGLVELVEEERASGRLRNDDVAAILISV